MPSKNFKKQLAKAAAEKKLAKRGVKIAAVIAQALRTIDQDPILVGGAAVEFYTEGGYATKDIDMIAPGGPPLWEIMKSLGFEKRGKDFIHEKLKIYIEFPDEALGEGCHSDIVEVDGIPLQIISIEDLIVDRLCAYKFWKSAIDGVAALLLLESETIDSARLKKQAVKEDVLDALETVQRIYEEAVRKKLSIKIASKKLKEWLVYPSKN